MAYQSTCDICGGMADYAPPYAPHDPPIVGRNCPRCGEFDFDLSFEWSKIKSPDQMVLLSAWVREQNAAGLVPVRITPEISNRVTRMPLPRLRERGNHALCVIARKYPDLENPMPFASMAADKELLALTYSATPADARTLISILLETDTFMGFGIPALTRRWTASLRSPEC